MDGSSSRTDHRERIIAIASSRAFSREIIFLCLTVLLSGTGSSGL
jgi:hypothetical protein